MYLLPHHAISRITYGLTRLRSPFATPVIRWFIKSYKVDLADAEMTDPREYPSFNAFFTRALKSSARPLDSDPTSIISPVDGTISAIGKIHSDQIFQAKGHDYSLMELLATETSATPYMNGHFATIYLSPSDYHRVHMPYAGTLHHMTYIPGRLFSVAPDTVATIPRLFARNERVVAHFDTVSGPMAVIMVGALNVAAIETVWSGQVTPPAGKLVSETAYNASGSDAIQINRGAELGRFNMGSTVILLFGPDSITWSPQIITGQSVRMGVQLGKVQIS